MSARPEEPDHVQAKPTEQETLSTEQQSALAAWEQARAPKASEQEIQRIAEERRKFIEENAVESHLHRMMEMDL